MSHRAAAAAAATLLLVPALAAQNPNAPATYATVQLNGGFVPDPNVINVTAGGSLQPGCQCARCQAALQRQRLAHAVHLRRGEQRHHAADQHTLWLVPVRRRQR
jgi:hypothetical protein